MGNASLARALLATSALALASCRHEDNGGTAAVGDISFAFELAGLSLNEGDAPTGLAVVLSTSLPELTSAASVEVYDLGTGSARSGLDHADFPPQRVTFAAGSLDGATAVVQLDPLDDEFVEAPGETVELGLRAPNGGVLEGTTQLTVTLVDADRAQVSFATAAGSASEGSTWNVAVELECGAGVTLQIDLAALVTDLGVGTATPGDYAAFPEQAFTFAVGSADGAVQTTTLALLDDSAPEVDETIALGLSSSSPDTLGAIRGHVLTIEDDDLRGNALFQASEGATGTENALVHDEGLDLGTDAIGGAPGAGTEVRVANLGGRAMTLGPPFLEGNHANDFAIVVESSSFAAPRADRSGRGSPAVTEAFAPLTVLPGDSGPGLLLALDSSELARMGARSAVTLHGVALPGVGPVTFELVRRPLPIASDAKLVIDGRELAGGPRTLLGDLQLWSGTVTGREGSRVFLALGREGLQGFVRLDGSLEGLVHVLAEGPERVRFVGEAELGSLAAQPPERLCAGERFPPGAAPSPLRAGEPGAGSTSALTLSDCPLALETDHQFFETLGSSSVSVTSYVTSLIAAIGEQYATDVQTTLSIAYLGVHTTADDGWSTQETEGGHIADLLYEFQQAWVTPWLVAKEARLAHFLSGAGLGGGVAYAGVLCDSEYAFGVSSVDGRIDWSTWTGEASSFAWDFFLVAHELGHNFGAPHTHAICPPLDECAAPPNWEGCQDETRCERGTIMSYCGLCGGMANVDLVFHPVSANQMREDVAFCLGPAALSPGDYLQYRLRFDPRTATGPRTTTLFFTHDALNAPQPFRVRLTGTAR